MATSPVRYRLMMLPAIIEKFSYGIAVIILFAQQRIHTMVLSSGIIDLILGVLFIIAFFKTKEDLASAKAIAE